MYILYVYKVCPLDLLASVTRTAESFNNTNLLLGVGLVHLHVQYKSANLYLIRRLVRWLTHELRREHCKNDRYSDKFNSTFLSSSGGWFYTRTPRCYVPTPLPRPLSFLRTDRGVSRISLLCLRQTWNWVENVGRNFDYQIHSTFLIGKTCVPCLDMCCWFDFITAEANQTDPLCRTKLRLLESRSVLKCP